MSEPQKRHGPDTRQRVEAANHNHRASNSTYHTDPRHSFCEALRAHGFQVEHAEADGEIHRVRVEGDRAGQQSGWCVLHLDGVPAGAFGNWKTGESHTWRSEGDGPTAAERERLRSTWAEAAKRRDENRRAEQATARARAERLWCAAAQPLPEHPYLIAKGVGAHGIRQCDDALVVPLRDESGILWSVQTIAPDGSKRFLRGARKRGLYHAIGGHVGGVVAICEGYATAVTVHEATGFPTACAFDAGNLEPVAVALRAKYPNARIVICADDDAATEERIGKNPGREAAERAARAVGGSVALPDFTS